MANIIGMGSLYLDGRPAEIGLAYKPGKTISIGETIPVNEIPWVVVNNMLIADRSILTGVSWDDLNAQNLVFGKEVTIGEFRFTARLLQVGGEESVPNEWDAALDKVGENNDIWHWKDSWFWGQEYTVSASPRAIRGYISARFCGHDSSSGRKNVGFRPALVPLLTNTIGDTCRGEKLMLWGGQNIAFGRLEELTDYEVVLSDGNGALSNMTFGEGYSDFGSRLSDGRIVIDRAAISGVQKT